MQGDKTAMVKIAIGIRTMKSKLGQLRKLMVSPNRLSLVIMAAIIVSSELQQLIKDQWGANKEQLEPDLESKDYNARGQEREGKHYGRSKGANI